MSTHPLPAPDAPDTTDYGAELQAQADALEQQRRQQQAQADTHWLPRNAWFHAAAAFAFLLWAIPALINAIANHAGATTP